MKQAPWILAAIVAVAGLSAIDAARPCVAYADASDSATAAKQPVARRLYEEGLEAAGKAHWAVAYERFKASYDVLPRVLTLFNLAGAQAQTGRLVEATETYRKFLRETSDGRYPDLRADALTQLERVSKQVSQVTLDISGIDSADVVTIDDIEFPQAVLHEPIPLNPGPHVAVVHRGDAVLITRALTLTSGQVEPVKIELPAQPLPGTRDPAKPADLTLHPDAHPATEPAATGVVLTAAPAPEQKRSVLRSPWLWSAAAVVIAGSVTAAYLLTRSDGDVLVVR
jgi:hypothetical protein